MALLSLKNKYVLFTLIGGILLYYGNYFIKKQSNTFLHHKGKSLVSYIENTQEYNNEIINNIEKISKVIDNYNPSKINKFYSYFEDVVKIWQNIYNLNNQLAHSYKRMVNYSEKFFSETLNKAHKLYFSQLREETIRKSQYTQDLFLNLNNRTLVYYTKYDENINDLNQLINAIEIDLALKNLQPKIEDIKKIIINIKKLIGQNNIYLDKQKNIILVQ